MPSSKCVIKWGRLFKWAKLTESNVQRRYCKCFSRSVEGLRTTQLKQHERGVLHRFRRATALGCSPNLPGTPSMDTFLGVVERRLKGESLRKSPLGRYKEKNISWCLNEAMLDMERKKLGKCQLIGYQVDEHIRHRAVKQDEPSQVARASADATEGHLGHSLCREACNEAAAQVASAVDVDVARRVVVGPRRKDREEVEVLQSPRRCPKKSQ